MDEDRIDVTWGLVLAVVLVIAAGVTIGLVLGGLALEVLL